MYEYPTDWDNDARVHQQSATAAARHGEADGRGWACWPATRMRWAEMSTAIVDARRQGELKYYGYGFRYWARKGPDLGIVEIFLCQDAANANYASLGNVDLYAAADTDARAADEGGRSARRAPREDPRHAHEERSVGRLRRNLGRDRGDEMKKGRIALVVVIVGFVPGRASDDDEEVHPRQLWHVGAGDVHTELRAVHQHDRAVAEYLQCAGNGFNAVTGSTGATGSCWTGRSRLAAHERRCW
jgi:hypothetical protein